MDRAKPILAGRRIALARIVTKIVLGMDAGLRRTRKAVRVDGGFPGTDEIGCRAPGRKSHS